MTKEIYAMYRKAGRTPPSPGKGEHTEAFHRMATAIMRENPSYSKGRAYSIAMGKLGRNKAVNKSHWSERRKRKANPARAVRCAK